ncbi:MAG: prenyltransferase/squalene oxidase repeat-containing protein [Pirellula sp.]
MNHFRSLYKRAQFCPHGSGNRQGFRGVFETLDAFRYGKITHYLLGVTEFAAAWTAAILGTIFWASQGLSQVQNEQDEVDRAIDLATQFLISQQQKNGSVFDRGHDNAMTALAIMALASVGHQPSDPTVQGQTMKNGLGFLLGSSRQDTSGYFGATDGSRMYGHGIVTLMLTEMLGMGGDDETNKSIHHACQKAIDLIVRSQKIKKPAHAKGGWRYTPDSADSDLSISVWQLMALRSAKNDGLNVPSSTIDDAVAYLVRSFTSPVDPAGNPRKPKNGFSYEANNDNPTFTMTASGLLAMQVCGRYDSPLVTGATEWLLEHPPNWKDRFVLYGMYYYAQGMHQRGGTIAEDSAKLVAEKLLAQQQSDGSWNSSGGEEQNAGKVYCTALAMLSLSVKYHYLPIYQR